MAKQVEVKLTYGSDPEFFPSKKGKLVPAFGKFGGTKKAGIKFGLSGSTFLEDGAALELNVPVQYSLNDLFYVLFEEKQRFENALAWNLSCEPQITLAPEDLENPLAKQIGCVEDLDAWRNGIQRKPFVPADFKERRYAGCHLHFGVTPWPVDLPKYIYVQFLDLFLGSQLHLVDDQQGRRQFYGLPGLYRETSYGVEYRTPSISILRDPNLNIGALCDLMNRFNDWVRDIASGNNNRLEDLDKIYTSMVDWEHLKKAMSKDVMSIADFKKIRDTLSRIGRYLGTGACLFNNGIPAHILGQSNG